MAEYQVVKVESEDEACFKVQMKRYFLWFFTFWIDCGDCDYSVGDGLGWSPFYFDSEEEANNFIQFRLNENVSTS